MYARSDSPTLLALYAMQLILQHLPCISVVSGCHSGTIQSGVATHEGLSTWRVVANIPFVASCPQANACSLLSSG